MRGRFVMVASAAVALVAASGGDAVADDAHELKHDLALDVGVSMSAVGLVVGSELGKCFIGPSACRWCDRDGTTDHLNALDRGARDALRWDKATTAAAHTSDVTGFIASPATAFGTLWAAAAADGASRKTPLDLLLVFEAVAVSAVFNQIVKFTAARERPYAHERSLSGDLIPRRVDDNLSFYSGHTSLGFTLASASGTIATLRGYDLAPLVWGASVSVAAFTGYLRIAADRHYFTDVLAGAIVGSAFGVLVPVLFHGRRSEATAASASPEAAPPATQVIGFGGAF